MPDIFLGIKHSMALGLIIIFFLLCALYCEIKILWEYYGPSSEDKQDKGEKGQSSRKINNTASGNFSKLRSQNKNLGLFLGNSGCRVKSRIYIYISYFFTKLFNSVLKLFRVIHRFITS